jgi:hypothetical protein
MMLLLVVSLALPTAILGRYGDQAIAVVLRHLRQRDRPAHVRDVGIRLALPLVDPSVDRGVFRFVFIQSLIIPVTFLVSIPIALAAGANAGEYSWILAFPLILGLRYLGTATGPSSQQTT